MPARTEMHLANSPHVIVFLFSLGTLATLIGYDYAAFEGNTIPQLAMVMRGMDPSFLTNDFFVNSSVNFGPRYYYVKFLALLAAYIPLSLVYLLLTILGNVLIALVTFLFARDLFDRSESAGLAAACVVMSIETFYLGYQRVIFFSHLEPSHLIMPLVLAAVYAGAWRCPITAVLLAGTASLVQPLWGIETGGVVLLALAVEKIVRHRRSSKAPKSPLDATGPSLVSMAAAAMLLIGFAALSVVPYMGQEHMPPDQFIYIYAQFRIPHHLLPSTYHVLDYLFAALFVASSGIALYRGSKASGALKMAGAYLVAMVSIIAALCLGGYVFVEVIPTRMWATAQTFRLVYLVKYLGLVIMAGLVGRNLTDEADGNDCLRQHVVWCSLLSPVTTAISHAGGAFSEHARKREPTALSRSLDGIVVVLVVAVLYVSGPSKRIVAVFGTFAVMTVIGMYFRHKTATVLIHLAMTAAVVWTLLAGDTFLPRSMHPVIEELRPKIIFADYSGHDVDVCSFARNNTPGDAVFLAPPLFGRFRIMGRRALVVDFKSFPLQDRAIMEWYRRIIDCYGNVRWHGFKGEREMARHYARISDSKLLALQARYGFSHAVLYRHTPTGLPVLYRNASYKVVLVKGSDAGADR